MRLKKLFGILIVAGVVALVPSCGHQPVISAVAYSFAVDLTWQMSAFTNYPVDVERRIHPSGTWQIIGQAWPATTAGTTSYLDYDFVQGSTKYSYRVKGTYTNSAGNPVTGYSNVVTKTTPQRYNFGLSAVPVAPDAVALYWNPLPSWQGSNQPYVIDRWTQSEGWTSLTPVPNGVIPPWVINHVDTQADDLTLLVQGNTTYTYHIRQAERASFDVTITTP